MKLSVLTKKRNAAFVAFVFSIACLCGCGAGDGFEGPTGTIAGQVLLNGGEPVPAGTVVTFLQISSGVAASSTTDADGKFSLDSHRGAAVPVGEYAASVSAPGPSSDLESVRDYFRGKAPPIPPSDIPTRYRVAETSGLSYEISEGENQFVIELGPKEKTAKRHR